MSSKRQTTMAKMKREQAVRERRVRKQEKKDERKRAAAEDYKASRRCRPGHRRRRQRRQCRHRDTGHRGRGPGHRHQGITSDALRYASHRSSWLDAAGSGLVSGGSRNTASGRGAAGATGSLAGVDDLGDLEIDGQTGEDVRVLRRQRVPPPEVGDHGAHRVLGRRIEIGPIRSSRRTRRRRRAV